MATKILRINSELKKLFPKSKIALNYGNNWELMVAVILSAQCTDKKVNQVTPALFKKYPAVADYAKANLEEFQKDIKSIGLFRAKAKNILESAKTLVAKHNGEMPKTMEEMLELNGIGRKSANIILWNAYGIITGVPVDTHVIRLSNLFGLIPTSSNSKNKSRGSSILQSKIGTKQKNPEKIEKDLMEILPKKEWSQFPYRLIDYGRKYCTARCKHLECPLKWAIGPSELGHSEKKVRYRN